MTYEEWLNNIKILENSNNEQILNKLLEEPIKESLKNNLSKQINNLIEVKLQQENKKIIRELENFKDENEFDLFLVTIRKDFNYIIKLSNLINEPSLKNNIKISIDKIYNIINNSIKQYDDNGILQLLVKNNRIKWSD